MQPQYRALRGAIRKECLCGRRRHRRALMADHFAKITLFIFDANGNVSRFVIYIIANNRVDLRSHINESIESKVLEWRERLHV